MLTPFPSGRCQKVCSLNGHPFASLYRIGSNPFCGCGDSLGEGAGRVITDCNSTCPGNSSQTCGGYWKYDIYYRSMADGNGTLPNTTSSTLIGCYQLPPADQPGLSDAYSFTSNQMTTAMCEEGCRELRGYSWFGTSSGHTCYCGKSYDLGSGMYVPQDQCQSPCYGNSSQTCGDLYKMSVYTLGVTPPPLANFATLPGSPGTPPFGSLGCYQRTSSVPINYTFNSANLTADACNIACNQIGQGISLVQANSEPANVYANRIHLTCSTASLLVHQHQSDGVAAATKSVRHALCRQCKHDMRRHRRMERIQFELGQCLVVTDPSCSSARLDRLLWLRRIQL